MREVVLGLGALVWIAVAWPAVEQAESLVLASDQFCPYVCEVDGDREGYLVDFARAVLAPAGISVVYEMRPWSRAMRSMEEGQVDGLLAVTESRSDGLVRSPALGVDSVGFMSEKPLIRHPLTVDTLYQLNGLRIAQANTKLEDASNPFEIYLRDRISRQDGSVVNVATENPAAQMIKMLTAGRVDVILDNPLVLAFTAHQLGQEGLILTGNLNARPLYIAFKNDALGQRAAQLLAEALPRWRADGRWATLLSRYGLVDHMLEDSPP